MSSTSLTSALIAVSLLSKPLPAAPGKSPAGGWKGSLTVNVTTTQTSYSDSWVGGEVGSVSWVFNLNGRVEKQLKKWVDFRSALKLAFGQTLTQQADSTRSWSRPRKSTDLIDWENVGRFTLQTAIDPYAAFRLETQFLDASFENKKRLFTPVRLTESVGIARKFYENDNDQIVSRLGLAVRQIIKNVVIDSLRLTTDDSLLTDGGFESVTDVNLALNEKMSYTGKLTLYKALLFSEKDEVIGTEFQDDWKAIDINWENIITASLSKVVAVNLYAQFLYDREVSRKGRFKETLAIGFVLKML